MATEEVTRGVSGERRMEGESRQTDDEGINERRHVRRRGDALRRVRRVRNASDQSTAVERGNVVSIAARRSDE
jgi:hypothetical protein